MSSTTPKRLMLRSHIQSRPPYRFGILCLALFTAGLSPLCRGQNSRDSLFRSRLDSLFVYETDENGPGESVLIQLHEKILYRRSFGLADLDTKAKFTENTVANLGSISKTRTLPGW